MSTSAETRPVDDAVIRHVAEGMREADRVEIWAASHGLPEPVLRRSVGMSEQADALFVAGVPIAIFGLVRDNRQQGTGIPWLLGTDGIERHAKEFLRTAYPVVQRMRKITPFLMNFVHADNEKSTRFLEHLGFTLHDPIPFGPDGAPFRYFYMGGA